MNEISMSRKHVSISYVIVSSGYFLSDVLTSGARIAGLKRYVKSSVYSIFPC